MEDEKKGMPVTQEKGDECAAQCTAEQLPTMCMEDLLRSFPSHEIDRLKGMVQEKVQDEIKGMCVTQEKGDECAAQCTVEQLPTMSMEDLLRSFPSHEIDRLKGMVQEQVQDIHKEIAKSKEIMEDVRQGMAQFHDHLRSLPLWLLQYTAFRQFEYNPVKVEDKGNQTDPPLEACGQTVAPMLKKPEALDVKQQSSVSVADEIPHQLQAVISSLTQEQLQEED